MNIRHDKYGMVEEVERVEGYDTIWTKNGAVYYRNRGWFEVPKKHWVEVSPSWPIGIMTGGAYRCDNGKHLRRVKRYDLPTSLVRSIEKEGFSLVGYLKPCLIVEEYK